MQVNCPHCQTKLDLSLFAAGTVIACGNCQQNLTVPAPVPESESVVVSTAVTQRSTNRRQRRAKARTEQRQIYFKLFAFVAMMAAVLGLFVTCISVFQSTPDSSDSNAIRQEAPPFSTIALYCSKYTDAKWNAYEKSLVGKKVTNRSGTVVDVNEKVFGGYEIWIDMDDPSNSLSIQDVYYPCSQEEAFKFNKGDRIEFSGVIESVVDLLGYPQITLQ